MDGESGVAEVREQAQEGAQSATDQKQAQQVAGDGAAGGSADAGADYKALLAERDARIAALEGEIAQSAKTAEAAEALRKEMDELRRQGEEQRVGFELQIAGARNVKAARALLADHGGDVAKLKEAEPWLFAGAAHMAAGATGLPNAGAASDDGKTVRRWREIAGLEDKE